MIESTRDSAVYDFLHKATILLILVTTGLIEMEIQRFFICHVTLCVHMFNGLRDLDVWIEYLLFI